MGVSTPRSSLQELPEKWKNTKKMATTVRQQVAPLQANEVALLRQRCTAFDTQQQQFRERFRKEAPFRCGWGNALLLEFLLLQLLRQMKAWYQSFPLCVCR